jgi:peptidoglycan/LPS O-acetylase OafA/YrhL
LTESATPVAHHEPIDPGKARRAASGIPIVPAFDGFRGIAILAIVVFHTLQNAAIGMGPEDGPIGTYIWAIDPGQSALNALFITSGFVMFLPIVARDGKLGSIRAFAMRRAARLFPAYFLVLILSLILIATLPFDPPLAFPGIGNIFLNFTTLEVPAELVDPQYYLGFGMNRAIWTLSSDVIFYILLVFFAIRWFRRPLVGLAISAAIAVAWRLLMTNLDSVSSLLSIDVSPARIGELYLAGEIQFPYWAFSFGVGMTVALVFSRRREIQAALDTSRARAVQIASVVGFAALAAIVAAAKPASVSYSPLLVLLSTAVIGLFITATILCSERWQMPFINEPVRWLGDVSYGIYLIHLVIITCLARLISMPTGTAAAAAIWLLAVVPLSILWGYASARFVERPVRAWASGWARRAASDTSGP